MKSKNKELPPQQAEELLKTLKTRFEMNQSRHSTLQWEQIQAKLEANPQKLWSINEMETTAGEPDVVGHDASSGDYLIMDCSPETPKGRRNVCYDGQALRERKEHKPASSAVDMATEMGIDMLSEEQYRHLQTLGEFDTKTSSWLKTPGDIRKLGGAIFGDRRYNHIFIYHNGAQSYYSVRGFRGYLLL
jgi:hypothetical protein